MVERKIIKEKAKGITLIALVLTIIVLIILAGVSITTLTGENGILTRAKEAKEKTEEATNEEEKRIEDMGKFVLKNTTSWNGDIAEKFASGSGTEKDPYIIMQASELAYLAQTVNMGSTTYKEQYIEIQKDINLSGNEWIGIGYKQGEKIDSNNTVKFEGNLNGNGHMIYGATMTRINDGGCGLFGVNEGKISNIKISSLNMEAFNYAGGIAAINRGEINNITIDKNTIVKTASPTEVVYSGRYCGGIVAYNYGNIDNCINYGTIITRESRAGGIVGQNGSGVISNCYNYGYIKFEYANLKGKYNESGFAVGGINGYLHHGEIKNSYNYGEIVGTDCVGGITGNLRTSDTYVKNCINMGKIVSKYMEEVSLTNYKGTRVGGIAGGQVSGEITNCTNEGEIIAEYQSAGGIVGKANDGIINNCNNRGNVTAKYHNNIVNTGLFSGGIVGLQQSGEITNCTNEGEIVAEQSIAGGITGRNQGKIINTSNKGIVKQKSIAIGDGTSSNKTGGISGDNIGGSIEYCYNTGIIESKDAENCIDEIGGIVGLNRNNGTVMYCYNQGILNGGNAQGGIVGQLYDGTLQKNYYYLENLNRAIGHNGSSYTEITIGSDIPEKAEIINVSEASKITNFEKFLNWIKTK